jgi:hypothetical protein
MKTICIYEFSELNPEAKELAIESVRDGIERMARGLQLGR